VVAAVDAGVPLVWSLTVDTITPRRDTLWGMVKSNHLSIRVSEETRQKLKVAAGREKRTVSNVVGLLIDDYLSQFDEPDTQRSWEWEE
jgi:hypothetical protein